MKQTKLTPFIHWAGGKTQILGVLKERLPKHFNTYREPFVGGGALFLDIHPPNAHINDVNEQLLNIYIQLRDNIESVISLVENFDAVPCDSDYYLKMRTLFNQKIQKHELDVECAALFIWINKHCFNGLYRVNSKGLFNVCFNKKTKVNSMNPDNLRAIGQYFRNSDITITHGDFEAACQNVKAGDFIYFDSPYVPISATACFTDYAKDGFTLDDHKRLAALCRQLDKNNIQFMCSNNDVPLVHELYDGFRIEKVDVRRSINCNASKRTGKEVIITNY